MSLLSSEDSQPSDRGVAGVRRCELLPLRALMPSSSSTSGVFVTPALPRDCGDVNETDRFFLDLEVFNVKLGRLPL
jgi:hypothetical protein